LIEKRVAAIRSFTTGVLPHIGMHFAGYHRIILTKIQM
jgi:hypothetical protein